ncbi:MAG: Tm-1-like ATP-binding domain-containing protein [bacterium]|nr:Tm-1-like ATP-binding domain-containing protein [bacterium]
MTSRGVIEGERMSPVIYAIATMDTKGVELEFVANCLRHWGTRVKTVDVGTLGPPTVIPDVSREDVLAASSLPSSSDPDGGEQAGRGPAISAMSKALSDWMRARAAEGQVAGVIGLGGSGGTALITRCLRELPVGVPKLMVSTVASGNTAEYVGCSDICMMYSVVDVAGLNAVSKRILANAAAAMCGMVERSTTVEQEKPTLGMTMFGVTTSCVTEVRRLLEARGFECLVFHATGSGGRAMEKLVDSGMIQGVLDITTTEVADEIAGGIMPAGKERFEAIRRARIPLVMSLGAIDMVNFGGLSSVPERYRKRQLLAHNEQITLMRTLAEENRAIASWIAEKLNRFQSPWRLLIPEGGVSALDAPDQPFHDREADQAAFDTLQQKLELNSERQLIRFPFHINAPEFARALVDNFQTLWTMSHRGTMER